MITASLRCWIAASILALAIAPGAHAELPQLDALQLLEPDRTDVLDDPEQPPSPPFFGSGLALQGNLALAGMPGAFDERGRVAGFVRNAAGQWIRRHTLTVSDAVPGTGFGEHVKIFDNRALIASRRAVYIFQLLSNKWQQTGKLAFGRSVQVHHLDWHWNTAVVGASDAIGNAAYVFHMNSDGTFRRIARLAPPDADAGDRFGERVAVYSATVAVTAPGYNSDQGAAYVFACSDIQCVERQKLLANDGEPGDDFGHAVDLANGILVVGAPNVDWVPGDPAEPPSQRNHRAQGAAYLFVRPGRTWIEQQKLRPSARQLNWYGTFGYQVAVSSTHVVVGAPYQIDTWEPGYVIDYRWSGGSLLPANVMTFEAGHGDGLALSNDTLLAGAPAAWSFYGAAAVYKLAAR